MALTINDVAPDFEAETTQGPIRFHEWLGDSWCVLFSHPKDFTPVCTTELGYMAGLEPEFAKRNCKIIGLSVDPVADHSRWKADIEKSQGNTVNYPMIGDSDLKVAKLYGMLPAEAGETCAGRTAANNATVRTVFMIGPDKNVWFTGRASGKIGSVVNGSVSEFKIPGRSGSYPDSIAVGPDGNLWFTESLTFGIGRFNPTTKRFLPRIGLAKTDIPTDILAGPGGNMWFTSPSYNDSDSRIGVIHPR